MYHDLNIDFELFKDKKTRSELLETVSKFGYEAIAVNETIDGRVDSGLEPSIRGSLRSEESAGEDKALRLRGIRILSRVTVKLGNAQRVDFLRAAEPALRKFDVVAVCPTSERQLKLCMELDFINIVAFENSARIPFNIKPQLIASLEAQGMLVEVVYAPAIRDASMRRLVVVNGSSISRITGSKTLLISSGARHVLELRPARDVINLVHVLFKITEARAKSAINTAPQRILNKIEASNPSIRRSTAKQTASRERSQESSNRKRKLPS
ncbi:hypothetical protein NDN08_000263 [Rhodosorus marinus]|uniref:Uncharacterized protein n=1 Tax=Rhodosorus marinus TaxID=101924 RepID=A0AAV8UEU1_9RHOD|nr:hypothetical protein NDN08_000263 [Rhodosorus marinus]